MAPEQAAGQKTLTTAVDVYALGAILYELLADRPPFRAATPLDTLLEVLEGAPPRPRAVNPAADPGLEAVCLKCLARDPQERYASAADLAADLERWLQGEPLSVRPGNHLAQPDSKFRSKIGAHYSAALRFSHSASSNTSR
jgi:serine/threonine-protein kinase